MALKKIKVNINIAKTFNKVYIPVMNSNKRYKVVFGGRGSGKSHWAASFLVILYLYTSGRNALALRKTAKSSRTSTFNYIRACINRWGLQDLIEINLTTMTFTFPNGNQIVCGGLDNADKLKSIMFANGKDLSDIWFEEGDQIDPTDFQTMDFTIRGINPQIIFTFNPVNKQSWIYKEFFERPREDAYVLRTNYLDNEFLNQDFIDRMERLKEEDPELYDIIGIGNWGNLRDIVYRNYEIKNIPLEDTYYDYIYFGLDFGFNDPNALVKVGIKDQEIYILNELKVDSITDDELFELMKDVANVPLNALIHADHAPNRQARIIKLGYRNMVNAIKTNKEEAVSQLSKKKIYVHPDCENFIKEISLYRWRKDSNGNVMDKLIDGNDHLLDAMLYSLREWLDNQNYDPIQIHVNVRRRR
jgi:phage terminase large subunit